MGLRHERIELVTPLAALKVRLVEQVMAGHAVSGPGPASLSAAALSVRASSFSAPTVTRVLVATRSERIEPVGGGLLPTIIRNRLGASRTTNEGVLLLPVSLFDGRSE
jgi:hypothetical protein